LVEDVAVLELDEPAPAGAVPHGVLLVSDWAGRRYMAYGFPESNDGGNWVDGKFKGEQVSGWVQMLSADGNDLQVDHGFSGGGVWDVDFQAFAGIMVATRKRGGQMKPVSYMIPGTILKKAWRDLPVIQPGPSVLSSNKPLLIRRYSLLDIQRGLIGRKSWLTKLDEWLAEPQGATILTLHAIGGTGKSALAWTWFNQLFADRSDLAGGLWYCFYEPGASFSDFLRRLYDYVLGSPHPVGGRSQSLGPEEFTPLFDRLREERYVIVLDGFERLLKAYGREQPAHGAQADLARNAELTLERERALCQGVDENVNAFLTALDQSLASRCLITSRLVPTATRNAAGQDRPHTRILHLDALEPDDVMGMMEAYGVRGARETILRVTARFGHHALLVKLIAAMVARDRAHVGDFDRWLSDHPGFEPTKLNITENRVHVLDYALRRLTSAENTVLLHAAALRGAVAYKDLHELLVGPEAALPDEAALDDALTTLDELKLVEWERQGNTYDLHPLVRNTVWLRASSATQEAVDERIIREFGTYSPGPNERDPLLFERQQDVFFALVRRGRYDAAWQFRNEKVFQKWEDIYSDVPATIALLTPLLTNEEDGWPRLGRRMDRKACLLQLAVACELAGNSTKSMAFYARHQPLCPEPQCMGHQARVLKARGHLIEAEHIERLLLALVRRLSDDEREISLLRNLAGSMNLRGEPCLEAASRRIAKLFKRLPSRVVRADVLSNLLPFRCAVAAEQARRGNAQALAQWLAVAQRAFKKAEKRGNLLHQVYALTELADAQRKQGALGSSYETARRAMELARRGGLVKDLIRALRGMATAALERGREADAERDLGQAVEMAERNDDRLLLGDLRLLQAKLSVQKGDPKLAANLARDAYLLAWCDGPRFSDAAGLRDAKELLDQLGQPIPVGLPVRALPPDWIEMDIDPPETAVGAEDTPSRRSWDPASPEEAQKMLYVPSPENEEMCEVDRLIHRSREALDARNYEQAEHWANLAVERDPQGDDCWKARADARWYCGDLEEAVRDYGAAIALVPTTDIASRAQYLAHRGQVCAALGHAPEALQDLGAALATIPPRESGDVWGAKALALALLGRTQEARKDFASAMRNSPDNARIYFYRGRSLASGRNRKGAREAFQRALSLLTPPLAPWMEREARQFIGD